jgi:hypothetical protein
MLKRITILLLLTFFTFSIAVQAQEEKRKGKDKIDDEEENFWDRWGKSKLFDWTLHGNPFIEFNYGLSQVKHNSFDTKFNDIGLAEVKLGYRDMNEGAEDNLLNLSEKYVFGSMIKKDFISTEGSLSKFNAEFLRFGFGNSESKGYCFGAVGILPYISNGIGWTSLRKVDYAGVRTAMITPDDEMLAQVGEDFRFGTVNEGGIKLELASTVSLNAGYEAAVIFPRHMFWYWAGSACIEMAGMQVLDEFVHRVSRSSPFAGPIVNFILKNAYSYGYYLLKKKSMNWPFETDAPMTIETFKIGITFTF